MDASFTQIIFLIFISFCHYMWGIPLQFCLLSGLTSLSLSSLMQSHSLFSALTLLIGLRASLVDCMHWVQWMYFSFVTYFVSVLFICSSSKQCPWMFSRFCTAPLLVESSELHFHWSFGLSLSFLGGKSYGMFSFELWYGVYILSSI